jgi:hypothetical protein
VWWRRVGCRAAGEVATTPRLADVGIPVGHLRRRATPGSTRDRHIAGCHSGPPFPTHDCARRRG